MSKRPSVQPGGRGIGASTTSRKSNPMVSTASKSRVGGHNATFASSRTVLSSASGKKLTAGGTDGTKSGPSRPMVQILDENGMDVTPQPLLQLDPSQVRKNQSNILGDGSGGTPTDLMSQASIYQTATSASTFGGPFARSVFSQDAASDAHSVGESMVEHGVEEHSAAEISSAWGEIKHKREEVKEVLTEDDLGKIVDITLEETDTIWMLDMPGTCVSLESDEAQSVKEQNERFKELVKSRVGNDRYMERGMNTFNDLPKYKVVQTTKIVHTDVGITATTWDMYDTYEAIEEAKKKAEEQDNQMGEGDGTMSRPTSSKEKKETSEQKTQTTEATDGVSRGNTQVSMRDSRATMMSSQFGSESNPQVKVKSDEEKAKEDGENTILKSENFKKDLVIMERVVNLNTYQPKQASYRHFEIIQDIDSIKPVDDEEEEAKLAVANMGPNLDRLWSYSCPLTKGKNVSCMSWNKVNNDLIAIGYGQYEFTNQKGGLVCCWSLKNPEFPERIYTSEAGVTAVDFSTSNPNLLAVGLYDGTVAIYNVRSKKNQAVLDSFDSQGKHTAPVWQLKWIEKDRGSDDRAEVLISVSTDGKIAQWSIRKGFECQDLMKLKRMASKAALVGHRGKEKKSDSLISRHSGGACFDFHMKDSNIYLTGTEEGHIHKCSCSYNEQFLDTYSAHNGPVYKIQWSPFIPDAFLSCSGDWSIRLWHQDHTLPALSCYSSTKAVYDVCWSPRSSTVFACVNEGAVEVWDLGESSLDPIIVNTPLPGIKLTSVTFAKNSESILVGDSEGQVTVYQLRCMPPVPNNQTEALMSIIRTSIASQKQLAESAKKDGQLDEEEEDEEER